MWVVEQVEDEEDPTAVIPFIPTSDGGQSRLKSEFEILRWLGKGGFGDVIKVSDARNNTDFRILFSRKSRITLF